MFNEHLYVLGKHYPAGTHERRVTDDYHFFVELFVNGRLPRWYMKFAASACGGGGSLPPDAIGPGRGGGDGGGGVRRTRGGESYTWSAG